MRTIRRSFANIVIVILVVFLVVGANRINGTNSYFVDNETSDESSFIAWESDVSVNGILENNDVMANDVENGPLITSDLSENRADDREIDDTIEENGLDDGQSESATEENNNESDEISDDKPTEQNGDGSDQISEDEIVEENVDGQPATNEKDPINENEEKIITINEDEQIGKEGEVSEEVTNEVDHSINIK